MAPALPTAKPRRPPWGALELISLTPTIFPALLYLPGSSVIRTPLRVLDFSLVLIVWGCVLVFGKPRVGRLYTPAMLLAGATGWLLLSIMHPTTNSIFSGTAEAVLVISIMSPVFWVPRLQIAPDRLTRVLRLMFCANLMSSLWGLGQVYMPDRFNPPDIQIFHRTEIMQQAMVMTMSSGREIIRPCGLTDTPGGASVASANVVIIGLIWSMRPMAFWRRTILWGFAFLAMGVIYITQVRIVLLTTVTSLVMTAFVFILRRDMRKATILMSVLGALIVSALGWAAFVGGSEVTKRFAVLFDDDPLATYQKNRGGFIQKTLEVFIPQYPLGAGLGRWGQIYYYFGDKKDPPGVGRGGLYSEVQLTAWVFDGGLPLVLLYGTAIAIAMWLTFRITTRGNDPTVSYWACAIFAMGLTLMAATMGSMPFNGPLGLQFWLWSTMLFAANEQAGVAARKAKHAAQRGTA